MQAGRGCRSAARGETMEAVLYASNDGTLVLVPACFEPSSDLVRAHGRFRCCGRVHIADPSCPVLCSRIAADFDQSSFSLLDSQDAEALFGPGMPPISGDRRHQPRDVQLFCRQQEPGRTKSTTPGPAIAVSGRNWPPAAALRAWTSIRAIAARTGTPMRDFVRLTRMATSATAAGSFRPGTGPRDAGDCTATREL